MRAPWERGVGTCFRAGGPHGRSAHIGVWPGVCVPGDNTICLPARIWLSGVTALCGSELDGSIFNRKVSGQLRMKEEGTKMASVVEASRRGFGAQYGSPAPLATLQKALWQYGCCGRRK